MGDGAARRNAARRPEAALRAPPHTSSARSTGRLFAKVEFFGRASDKSDDDEEEDYAGHLQQEEDSVL